MIAANTGTTLSFGANARADREGGEPPRFTFVLPAFNEAMNLEPMAERLLAIGQQLGGGFEIVWVNDGSRDGTAEKLDALAAEHPEIRPLHFSRNFGHMPALTAGLEHARATGAIISLDSDGQHPPELIPEMVRRWEAGADIVQTIRRSTGDETFFKKTTSRMFYAFLNRLSSLELPAGAADFRLLDRQAADALIGLPERVRFMRGLVHWVGFQLDTLPYDAPPRMGGSSKYRLSHMLKFALSGIVSFSVRPLRMIFGLGVIALILTFLYGIYVAVKLIGGGYLVPGWASLMLVMMFLGSVQLITLGVLSEYVGRIYDETKHRPIYLVRKPRGGAK